MVSQSKSQLNSIKLPASAFNIKNNSKKPAQIDARQLI